MEPDEFDLAGFCIGVGERSRLLDGSAARAGDAIVGLASSGLHANGYSLVRALVAEHGLALGDAYAGLLRRVLGDAAADEAIAREARDADATLGDVLLTPTRIYARDLLAIRAALEAAGHEVRGIAHITGGGLPGQRAARPAGGARRAPGPGDLADALGHARAGRARGDRGRGAARDVQRGAWAWSMVVPAEAAAATVELAHGARHPGLGRGRGRGGGGRSAAGGTWRRARCAR